MIKVPRIMTADCSVEFMETCKIHMLLSSVIKLSGLLKYIIPGRSQDGRGIGRGDHFLFDKFIERTTEQ